MATGQKPRHPGAVLREGVFSQTGLTVTAFAKRIGVTRVALSRVLNGKAGISADMAVRIAAALGGSAETWLQMQGRFDLFHARQANRAAIAKIAPVRDQAA